MSLDALLAEYPGARPAAIAAAGRFSIDRTADHPGIGRAPVFGIAVAVALAESGGDPSAVNENSNGSTDRGLWQINSVHLGSNGQLRNYSPDTLFDPTVNAVAADTLSKGGTDWSPWSASSGRAAAIYRKHLADDDTLRQLFAIGATLSAADGSLDSGLSLSSPLGAVLDVGQSIAQVGGVIADVAEAVLNVGWWKRAGLVVASLALLLLAVSLLAKDALLPGGVRSVLGKVGKLPV